MFILIYTFSTKSCNDISSVGKWCNIWGNNSRNRRDNHNANYIVSIYSVTSSLGNHTSVCVLPCTHTDPPSPFPLLPFSPSHFPACPLNVFVYRRVRYITLERRVSPPSDTHALLRPPSVLTSRGGALATFLPARMSPYPVIDSLIKLSRPIAPSPLLTPTRAAITRIIR